MTRYVIKAPLTGITADSRKVEKGYLFMAFPGELVDGRKFIPDAIKRGAQAVLWDDDGFQWNQDWDVKNIGIPNLKYQAGHIASQFFKQPSSEMWVVGVTGTNGKTSVTHGVAQAFDYLQKRSAVVGTVGNGFLHQLEPSLNTTPGSVELQQMLALYRDEGADVVAMEASSHGLDQGRLNGVSFSVAVFTNLTQDHLDYHKTMEAYQEAKRKLFTWPSLKASVLNSDDAFGRKLIEEMRPEEQKILSYGLHSGEVRALHVVYEPGKTSFQVVTPYGNASVTLSLMGEFNVYNALAVLSVLLVSGVDFDLAIQAIAELKPVPGRMQLFGGKDKPLVVVDYAHTPDALEKVLQSLKEQSGQKLVCVFGCGGDRDNAKRPMMGEVVSRYADAAIVTTDNPRTEVPDTIIAQIVAGMNGRYVIEPDRAKAIFTGVMAAKPGDVVLVAGKGHETYQEIQGVRHYFSDAAQVEQALNAYDEVMA